MNVENKSFYPRSLIERYTTIHGDPFAKIAEHEKLTEKLAKERNSTIPIFWGFGLLFVSVAVWVLVMVPTGALLHLSYAEGIPFVVFTIVLNAYVFIFPLRKQGRRCEKIEEEVRAVGAESALEFVGWLDKFVELSKAHMDASEMSGMSLGQLRSFADWSLRHTTAEIRSTVLAYALDNQLSSLQQDFRELFACYHALHIIEGTPNRYVGIPPQ